MWPVIVTVPPVVVMVLAAKLKVTAPLPPPEVLFFVPVIDTAPLVAVMGRTLKTPQELSEPRDVPSRVREPAATSMIELRSIWIPWLVLPVLPVPVTVTAPVVVMRLPDPMITPATEDTLPAPMPVIVMLPEVVLISGKFLTNTPADEEAPKA